MHTASAPRNGYFGYSGDGLGLYGLVVAIWGTSWIGLKFQVAADVEVLASVAYRFAVAALVLFAWCVARRLPLRFTPGQHVRIAAQGALLFSANYVLMYLAARHLTSGLLAVAFSTVIVFNLVLAALFLGQPLERRLAAGALLGLGGVALVFWPEIGGFSLADGGARGALLALAGTLCAAVGMTIAARNQHVGLPVVSSTAYGMAWGAVATTVLAFASGTHFGFALTPAYVGSLLYLALVASVLAFCAYLTLLGRIGTARASYASLMFPVLALAVSTWLEGYVWTPMALGGVVLVLAGNWLVLARPAAAAVGAAAEAEA